MPGPLYDLPLAELRAYRTAATPPDDLDEFWQSAIGDANAWGFEPTLEPYRPEVYRGLDVADVTFSGADGDPVRASVPPSGGFASRRASLPRRLHRLWRRPGLPAAAHALPACGYATFVMDTGQGGTWSAGQTPDPGAGCIRPRAPRRDDAGNREPRDVLLPPALRGRCPRRADASRSSRRRPHAHLPSRARARAARSPSPPPRSSRRPSACVTPTSRSSATSSGRWRSPSTRRTRSSSRTSASIRARGGGTPDAQLRRQRRPCIAHYRENAHHSGSARHGHAAVNGLRRVQRSRVAEGNRRPAVCRARAADEPRGEPGG